MSDLAKLDGFTLREVSEVDRPMLNKWIKADPRHGEEADANYFLGLTPEGTPDPRPTCYAIEDQSGNPLLFIRLSKIARVRIQFQTSRTRTHKLQTAQALIKGMAYLETLMAQANVEEWIFDTENMELATFAITNLGFEASPDELKRGIKPPGPPKGQGEAVADGNGQQKAG
jgi:hypothetical protein